MTIKVEVTMCEPPAGDPASTVWFGTGETEAGVQVRFLGDWRPMLEIHEALARGEAVTAEIEPWQLYGD